MQTFYWQRYSESRLLKETISRLSLKIEQSALEPLIEKLYGELTSRGLAFEPPCFLADEWFCPVGVPAIGIPFYLAHTRLRRLEKKMILDVEGGSTAEFDGGEASLQKMNTAVDFAQTAFAVLVFGVFRSIAHGSCYVNRRDNFGAFIC